MTVELQPTTATRPKSNLSLRNFWLALKHVAWHWPFLVVLVLYFGLAGAYSRATPMWETPDEPSHFAYVRYIQEHGGPPIQSFQEGKNEVETGHHPLLYYAIGRLLVGDKSLDDFKKIQHNPYFRFGNNDGGVNVYLHTHETATVPNSLEAGYILRTLSIYFGAGTLIVTYLCGLLIFGKLGAGSYWRWASQGRAPATLAAVYVGLLPQFGFLSGAINNDNAIIFFCSLTLLGCLWLILRPGTPRWWEFAIVGAIVGLGMLAKYNEIAYIPLVALAVAVIAWRARSWKLFIKGGLISGGVCIAVSGWWFVRSQILYGDPAGWGMWRSSFASVDQSATFQWSKESIKHIWSRWFDSWYGTFGWMNIPLEPELYSWPARVMVVAGLGLALLSLTQVLKVRSQKSEVRRKLGKIEGFALDHKPITNSRPLTPDPQPLTPNPWPLAPGPLSSSLIPHPSSFALCLIFLAVSVVLVLISAANYAATFGDAGTQGRYLFPMLSAFALGTAAGLMWFPGLINYFLRNRRSKAGEIASRGVAWGMVLVAGVALWLLNLHAINDKIVPAYTLPTNLSMTTLPPTATPTQGGEFAPGMWLAGYEVSAPSAKEIKPGEMAKIKFTLYWRARNRTGDNWIGFVHLYHNGQDIGQHNGPPGEGRYQTYFWKKGEIVKDERVIPVKGEAWAVALADGQPLKVQLGWLNSNGGARAKLNSGQEDFYFSWTPGKTTG